MKLRVIGDVHGKISDYYELIKNIKFSICVGDFGFKPHWDWHRDLTYITKDYDHYIVPGNHDYGPYMEKEPAGHFKGLGNHFHFPGLEIFTVRGANSIDKHLRVEGVDWFANEELNYEQQLAAYDAYVSHKPKIVISHDCPQSLRSEFFNIEDRSQTSIMLEHMYRAHQPKLWIFGHHHRHLEVRGGATEFICLNELEILDLDL